MQHDGRSNDGWPRDRSSSRPRPQGSRGNRDFSPAFNTDDPHRNQSGSNDNQRRKFHPRNNFFGFKKLEEIAKTDTKETLAKLMENRNAFIELIQAPIERFDVFVLITEIIAKVCQSSFDETKSKLLLDIFNSNFIVSFKSYLMELPYVQSKMSNNLYWKDQEAFWRNFVEFCQCIVNTYPTLALDKCRSLLEATSKTCLDLLKERHAFELPQECNDKLVELRERMVNFEKKNEVTLPIFLHILTSLVPLYR